MVRIYLLVLKEFFSGPDVHIVRIRVGVLQGVPATLQQLRGVPQILPIDPGAFTRHHLGGKRALMK